MGGATSVLTPISKKKKEKEIVNHYPEGHPESCRHCKTKGRTQNATVDDSKPTIREARDTVGRRELDQFYRRRNKFRNVVKKARKKSLKIRST
jgi:hypothetical protein